MPCTGSRRQDLILTQPYALGFREGLGKVELSEQTPSARSFRISGTYVADRGLWRRLLDRPVESACNNCSSSLTPQAETMNRGGGPKEP